MTDVTHIVALSGGKDSTAMALKLAEAEPRDYTYLITPTGDELPEMLAHWANLETLLGKPLTRVQAGTLNGLIDAQHALPSWRMRWCTRMLKITPALDFYAAHTPAVAYVGLRADEDVNERTGILGADVPQRFPLREWGWGVKAVRDYLKCRGVVIPERTDCARCYDQRVGEWERLFWRQPQIYADAERQEAETGHTFRSPGAASRKHPAALCELRGVFEKRGRPWTQLPLIEDDEDETRRCRVCTL